MIESGNAKNLAMKVTETVGPVRNINDIDARAKLARLFRFHYSRETLGTACVAFFFTLYNVSVLGPILPLAVMAGLASCSLLYYREIYYFLVNNKIIIFYPILPLVSSTWSSVPSLSLWYGFQLLLTIAGGIFMGITATPRQIVRGIFISTALIIIASVISGRKGPSQIGLVLIGITGSKSILAVVGAILVGAGTAMLIDRKQPFFFRLLSLALTPVGFYLATHAGSATAQVSALALPIAILGFSSLRYFTHAARWAFFGVVLVVTIPMTVVILETTDVTKNVEQRVLRGFNKDATLTGRTIMWAKADAWIAESPVIGHGYRAFWSSGSSDSLGILHFNKLIDYRGFQLHNTVKEIRVDTGWLGLILFLSTATFFLYKTVALAFLYPSPGSAFLAALYLMTICFMPIGTIIGVFYPGTVQFYVCGTAAIVFFMNRKNELTDASLINTQALNDYAGIERL